MRNNWKSMNTMIQRFPSFLYDTKMMRKGDDKKLDTLLKASD